MRNFIKIIEETETFSRLYHCSPRENLASIKSTGLDPSKSKWSSSVYLAGDEGHARGYEGHHQQTESVILMINVSRLDQSKLGPDDVDLPDCLDDPDEWDNFDWQESIKICGQCCYNDVIPPSAIQYRAGDDWLPV